MRKPRTRHVPIAAIATAALIAGPILLYRAGLMAGLTAAVGSTTIALIVLAHLGVLATVIGTFVGFWGVCDTIRFKGCADAHRRTVSRRAGRAPVERAHESPVQ